LIVEVEVIGKVVMPPGRKKVTLLPDTLTVEATNTVIEEPVARDTWNTPVEGVTVTGPKTNPSHVPLPGVTVKEST